MIVECVVRTNLDHPGPGYYVWPEQISDSVRVGDYIEDANHFRLRVVSVTHSMKRFLSGSLAQNVPILIIEVNR